MNHKINICEERAGQSGPYNDAIYSGTITFAFKYDEYPDWHANQYRPERVKEILKLLVKDFKEIPTDLTLTEKLGICFLETLKETEPGTWYYCMREVFTD